MHQRGIRRPPMYKEVARRREAASPNEHHRPGDQLPPERALTGRFAVNRAVLCEPLEVLAEMKAARQNGAPLAGAALWFHRALAAAAHAESLRLDAVAALRLDLMAQLSTERRSEPPLAAPTGLGAPQPQ